MQTETKSQHTPGPWRRSGAYDVLDADGEWVAEIHGAAESWEPRARLIAAAPELLEAAKVLRAELLSYRLAENYPQQTRNALAAAGEAIAKAEGR